MARAEWGREMTESEANRWNSKISEFFVTRHSVKSGRLIMVGKSHKTIQAALKAAERADKRCGGLLMHFIDSVRPKTA